MLSPPKIDMISSEARPIITDNAAVNLFKKKEKFILLKSEQAPF